MNKKVLHILASNSFSGAENVVCTIIENCKKYDMFYCCPKGPIEEILKQRNINYIPIKNLNPIYINKICKENNIEIIHAHDMKASFSAALTGFKGKIISQLHVNFEFNKKWNIYTILYRIVMNKFYKIVAVSKLIFEEAIFIKNKKDKKYVVIDNVLDKNRIIKKSNEFKTKKYDLIYVGRLIDIKRPNWIIAISKEIVKEKKNFKVCIIGKGKLFEDCEKLISEYKLEKNVELLGFKSNPYPYLKNSEIAILPSIHEGLPMSVIESMVLKTPVLNSGVDGLKDLFKDNKEFICNTKEEYIDRINKIINGELNLKDKCEKIISDKINIKAYVSKIYDLYEGRK